MNPVLVQHLLEATQLFAVVAVLCVLVTGFFIGRRWLNKVGDGGGSELSSKEVYKYWRSSGHSPRDMQRMSGGWRKL